MTDGLVDDDFFVGPIFFFFFFFSCAHLTMARCLWTFLLLVPLLLLGTHSSHTPQSLFVMTASQSKDNDDRRHKGRERGNKQQLREKPLERSEQIEGGPTLTHFFFFFFFS